MKNLLDELIPQGRRGLGIWLVSLVLVFIIYYFAGAYSDLEQWVYDQQIPDLQYVDTQKSSYIKIVLIETPKYIADFLENNINITLENVSNVPQTAYLTVICDPDSKNQQTSARVFIYGEGEEHQQNTIVLEDIPPRTQVRAHFSVRVSNAKKGDSYHIKFLVNQQEFLSASKLSMDFDAFKRLRLWVVSMFLFPPGANIILPILTMLAVSWWESFCYQSGEKERAEEISHKYETKICKKLAGVSLWMRVVMMVFVSGVTVLILPIKSVFVLGGLVLFIAISILCLCRVPFVCSVLCEEFDTGHN